VPGNTVIRATNILNTASALGFARMPTEIGTDFHPDAFPNPIRPYESLLVNRPSSALADFNSVVDPFDSTAEKDPHDATADPASLNGSVSENYGKGYIPSRLDLHASPTKVNLYASEVLPAYFDLRNADHVNRVSPVKNQGSSGSCWAFAAIGSLESCLLPQNLFDFSENNMKNESGFDLHPNLGGGNHDMAIAYLARWGGPISESDDPYDPSSTSSLVNGPVQAHLQEAVALPARSGPLDNEAIKQAIMTHGAVAVSMYMGGLNETRISQGQTYAYYSSVAVGSNHGVLLVGWDDGSSTGGFSDYDHGNAVPPGNGAFIVKNSWGTSWGEDGYFYISYYDANLARDTSYVYTEAESSTNYADIYQYDPLGCTGTLSGGGDIWMANQYTKGLYDGSLEAVSFYTLQSNTTYHVYVCSDYAEPADLANSRTLAAVGTIAEFGYFTIDLDNPVAIAPGDRFAIIVQLSASAGAYAPIEYAIGGYSSLAESDPGESFLSLNGSTWQDLTEIESTANFCLKAFTATKSVTAITLKSPPAKNVFPLGSPLDLSGATITVNYSDGTKADIPVTMDMASGYDMNTLGDQTVTITYADSTTTFPISIIANIITDPGSGLVFDMITGTITGYTGNPVNLTIPSSISGYPVLAIGYEAFISCSSLVTVNIPGSVVSIGPGAFGNCQSLVDVSIGIGVEIIHGDAFYSCSALRTINIPNSVSTIGDAAFINCTSLQSISIPASVHTIGDGTRKGTFMGCSSLTAIHVNAYNPAYASIDGVLFNKTITELIQYPCGKTATAYAIPTGITCIGLGAFASCRQLKSITIPSSVSVIEAAAFSWCTALETVQIPAKVSHISDQAFYSCASLKSIILPNGVTSIGSWAFGWCDQVTTLVIPESVTAIEQEAFHCMKSLPSVSLSSNVMSIGTGAFLYCESLTAIQVDSENPNYLSEDGVLYNKSKTILMQYPGARPNPEYVFPASLLSIDASALADCRTLSTISVPISNPNYASISGVLYNKTKNHLIQYPMGKTNTTYTIPVSTITVGRDAFVNCHYLTTVIMNEGLTRIESAAFQLCTSLSSVSLPKTLTTIDKMAFSICTSLTSITVPASVSLIDDYAFADCSNLSKAVFLGNRPYLGFYVFSNSRVGFTLLYHLSSAASWAGYTEYPTQKYCFTRLDLQDGKTPVAVITNVTNGHIQAPASPTRIGYTFAGWYKDAACTKIWNFASDVVTTDITLYAKWTVNKYTVTFNSNGGSSVSNVVVLENDLLAPPPVPTKSGCTFIGWFKESSLINRWDFAVDRVTRSMTLYAGWIQTPINIKAASASYNSIQLSWSPATGASGYEVWRKLWSTGTFMLVSTQIQTSLTNAGLAMGKTYYYKVRAYRLVGTTKVFSKDSAIVAATPTLSIPTGVKASSAGYNSAKVTWAAVSGASGYEVWRKLWSTGAFSLISTQTTTSLTNSGLATNKTYYYMVRAYRMVGTTKVYSKDSTIVSATPIPAAPTSLKVVSGGSKTAKVTWTSVAGASGYEVYRKLWSTGTYSMVSRQTALSLANSGLLIGKTYYYKIRAYRMVGTARVYSPDSMVVSFTPLS